MTRTNGTACSVSPSSARRSANPALTDSSTHRKLFKSIVPDPKALRDPVDNTQPKRFFTNEHPIQSFLWSDYTAFPDTRYKFTVIPMYGTPGNLQPDPALTFEVQTEKEFDQGHGVWFNRGAIASQAFARRFKNKAPAGPERRKR